MKNSIDEWRNGVIDGDVELVRQLMDLNPELVNQINAPIFPFDSPALFHCRDNLAMADLLLGHGADINQKTGWWAGGFGILEGIDAAVAGPLIERGAILDIWSATSLDRMDDVRRLLYKDPNRITAGGGDGKHPLHYARSVDMVDLLIRRGADVNARDVDHTSTPLQYLISTEPVARRLIEKGAEVDIFAAASLGDINLLETCLAADPAAADSRLGCSPWKNEAGGFIYNWTLGHDMTPQNVARLQRHDKVLGRLLDACSPQRQLTDAIWNGDSNRTIQILDVQPGLMHKLTEDDRQMLARASWWYRPDAVRLMLQLGFDPHVTGVHDSIPLDRAAFHGYADIVEMLLETDTDPPLERKNEFGGTPIGACLHGFRHGWKTGHPQDHYRTIQQLVDAGSTIPKNTPPTGSPEIDRLLGY